MAVVMIGVDPHKGSHTAVAIGPAEEPLGELRVRASAAQAQRLVAWAADYHVTLVSLAFAFLRTEQAQAKKTSGAMFPTLPQVRARLQVQLIRLAGQCPWCKTCFDNTA